MIDEEGRENVGRANRFVLFVLLSSVIINNVARFLEVARIGFEVMFVSNEDLKIEEFGNEENKRLFFEGSEANFG